ncbi:hypothetical protein Afil01_43180 [Actinorhabdospora filicis]|uniref:Copper chaperone PCu(A)C n=1 Tax=Actinorhabdospora filicis TaxID=1785913 RepID=A0A9W6SRP1_9ACTN|nr:copper chaperone PCu(A)C [Actinorhabdospora filicis]GLZ79511.1 hypothetical protein Afil01_43180 [Actinorhabdospora filicis]
MRLRVLAILGLTLLLAACGAKKDPAPQPEGTPAGLSVTDPWAKAADQGMSAVFGALVNHSTKDITVVKAEGPIGPMELHEVVDQNGDMVMRPKEGGFVIPAGATVRLEPGHDHIMLMAPAKPLKPGDEVAVTLTFADGGTMAFTAIVKDFAGGGESYMPGMDHS